MIKIIKNDSEIFVTAPYQEDFPRAARQLGGRWASASKQWVFDARDHERVKDLCADIYGTDGSDCNDLVTLQLIAGEQDIYSDDREALYVGPIQIARAYYRDSRVDLGDNVIISKGLARSGGSRKNWKTVLSAGSHVEIRDIPRGMAEAALGEATGEYSDWADAQIPEDRTIDRQSLHEEANRLRKRLAEIDALLSTAEQKSQPENKSIIDADLIDN